VDLCRTHGISSAVKTWGAKEEFLKLHLFPVRRRAILHKTKAEKLLLPLDEKNEACHLDSVWNCVNRDYIPHVLLSTFAWELTLSGSVI